LVRWGVMRPSASQKRSAEEEIPSLCATSEMRNRPAAAGEFDGLEKFFLLDTGPSFL